MDSTHRSTSSSEQTTRAKRHKIAKDELGLLEDEFGVLTSGNCSDWSKIDRAVWAFFNMLSDTPSFPVRFDETTKTYVSETEPFVADVMTKTCQQQNIVVHKFFVLVAISMFPVVEKYYTCEHNRKKMEVFTKILKEEMKIFLAGGLKQADKMETRLDAKYPSMRSFVAEMITTYVQL